MKFKIKIIMYASIALLFFSAQSFSDTIKYYNSDGIEISAETYQKESKIFENKYRQTKRNWDVKKTDEVPIRSKAVKKLPSSSEDVRHKMITNVAGGKHQRTIEDLNKAINQNPNSAMAYNNRGAAYARKDQFDQAIADFTKAVEINPRDAMAYNNRGLANVHKGQYGQAISDFTKAIEINPRDAKAYNNRGFAYYYKGEHDKAWEDVHKAQSLGYQVHPGFLKALHEASGRQK